jgi:hypothetical protein
VTMMTGSPAPAKADRWTAAAPEALAAPDVPAITAMSATALATTEWRCN